MRRASVKSSASGFVRVPRSRKDFRVSLILPKDTGQPGAPCVKEEGKNRVVLDDGAGASGSLCHYIFDGVHEWSGQPQVLHDSCSRSVVSAVNRGYNGCIIVCDQNAEQNTSALIEGGSAMEPGVYGLCVSQMLSHVEKTNASARADSEDELRQPGSKAQLAICVVAVSADAVVDLNTSSSTSAIEIRVDSDGHANFEGAQLKLASNVQEAQKVVQQAATRRSRKFADVADVQTLICLEMIHVSKRRRSSSVADSGGPGAQLTVGDAGITPITGRLTLSLLSPLTEEDCQENSAMFTLQGQRDRARSIESIDPADFDNDGGNDDGDLVPPIAGFMQVVQALSDTATGEPAKYRSTYLTQALRNALGGNCRTNVIVHVAQPAAGSDHTQHVLDFVTAARSIVNSASVSRKFQAQNSLMTAYTKQMNVDVDSDGSSEYDSEGMGDEAGADGYSANNNLPARRRSSVRRKVLMPGVAQRTLLPTVEEPGSPAQPRSRDIFARGPANAVFFPEEDSWKAPAIGAADILARGNSHGQHKVVAPPMLASTSAPPPPPRDIFAVAHRPGALPSQPQLPSLGKGKDRDPFTRKRGSTSSLDQQKRKGGQTRQDGDRRRSLEEGRRASQQSVVMDQSPGGKKNKGAKPVPDRLASPSKKRPSEDAAERATFLKLKGEYEKNLEDLSSKYKGLLGDYQSQNEELEKAKASAAAANVRAIGGGDAGGDANDAAAAAAEESTDVSNEAEVGRTPGLSETETLWDNLIAHMTSDPGFGEGSGPEASFTLDGCVVWLMENMEGISTRDAALELAQSLMEIGAIQRTDGSSEFEDDGGVHFKFHWKQHQKEMREAPGMAAGDTGTITSMSGFMYDEGELNTAERPEYFDDYDGEGVNPDDHLLMAIAADDDIINVKAAAQQFGVDTTDKLGRTAVAYSVIIGNKKVTTYLASIGGDVNAADVHGHTPLLWAVYRGRADIVAVLLKYGAMVEVPDSLGRTPVHWATRLSSLDCLKVLLKSLKNNKNVKEEIDYKAFVINVCDRSEQLSALHWAVAADNAGATKMLLRAGADPGIMDVQGRTPLAYATHYGSTPCLNELVTVRPDCLGHRDSKGRTALHLVAGADGRAKDAQLVLRSAQINVNACDLQLRTPLHWAATFNQVSVIKLLLKRGARLDAHDVWGAIPIELAVARGNVEAAKVLGASAEALAAAGENRTKHDEGDQATLPADPTPKDVPKIQLTQVESTKSQACTIL